MKYYFFAFLLTTGLSLKADVGNFDVIELIHNNEKYYSRIWSPGILKNNDLCYYDWEGGYLNEVNFYFDKTLSRIDSIEIYKEIVKINLFDIDSQYEAGSILCILKKMERISIEEFKQNFKIINAYRGNTAGFIYTETLSEDDNFWIEDYEIAKILDFNDYELCSMSLYGIKNNYSKFRIEEIREEIDILLKDYKYEQFYEKLDQLLYENIIMIGMCSC